MEKTTLQDLTYRIERCAGTPAYAITQYREAEDGAIYLVMRCRNKAECAAESDTDDDTDADADGNEEA